MAVSILLGSLYMVREANRRGLDGELLLDAFLWALVGGIVGARLLFVLFNEPTWFWRDPVEVLRVWQGGLAWDGGLLGGILGAWLYLRRREGRLWLAAFDLAVPGLGLGYMLVRMGNIFNHEVLGRPTAFFFGPWAAQPIGSSIGLVLLLRYVWLERRGAAPGYQFWSAMFYYQVMRGVVEETVRNNPLYLIRVVSHTWGMGFTTIDQLFTPAILLITYILMRRSAGSREAVSG